MELFSHSWVFNHLGRRQNGFLFESNRHSAFSTRRIQQIIKAVAENAGITKNIYPHLLRHTVATFLLERGMPLEQIQKFLGQARTVIFYFDKIVTLCLTITNLTKRKRVATE